MKIICKLSKPFSYYKRLTNASKNLNGPKFQAPLLNAYIPLI